MTALRAKSLALSDLFIDLVKARCSGHGPALVTPRGQAQRGSQICLSRGMERGDAQRAGSGAFEIVQALLARGVVGDFRAGDAVNAPDAARMPDILRFGFTPMYLGFADVWDAVEQLRQVLKRAEWREPRFTRNDPKAVI